MELKNSKPTGVLTTVVALNSVSGISHLAQIGIFYPLLALWLNARGMSTTRVGLVVSSVWIGMLLGNLYAPVILQKLEAKTVAALSVLGTAILALVSPQLPGDNLLLWLAIASAFGICVGLRWIAVESWLYGIVEGHQKGRLVGIHETLIYAAQAAGPLAISYAGLSSGAGFYAAMLFALLAAFPLLFTRVPMSRQPLYSSPSAVGVLAGIFAARHEVSIKIGLLAGIIDGVLLGMISIYLVKQGFDERQTALMLSVFGLGGLLSQLPLGWISDRHGLTRATKISAWIGAAGILLVLFDNHVLIWTGVGLLGVLSACGLTLSVIAATEHSARHSTNIVVAVARVSIVFSLGSAAGPAAAGVCMDYFGPLALPLLTALSCVALYRIN